MNSKMIIMVSMLLLPINSLIGMQFHKFNGRNVIMPGMAAAGFVVAGLSFRKLAQQRKVNSSNKKRKESLEAEIGTISGKEKALDSIEQILAEKIFPPKDSWAFVEEGVQEILAQEEIILGSSKSWDDPLRTRLGFECYHSVRFCKQRWDVEQQNKEDNAYILNEHREDLKRQREEIIGKKKKSMLYESKHTGKKPWQFGTLGALGIGMGAFAVLSMIKRK